MKKGQKIIFVCAIVLAMVFSHVNATSAKEAFDIASHRIDIVVSDNGELNVVETMSVHFNEKRHGIYVDIPLKYSMEWNHDGSTALKNYYFPVKNAKVLSSHEYETEKEVSYFRFIIGDANHYAKTEETYQWSYTIVTRDLQLDGLQMVFLNLISNGWDTTTDRCDFTITFPKTIDSEKVTVATPEGWFRGLGNFGSLDIQMVGNQLIGSYTKQIQSDEGLSLRVILPENYFTFADFNDSAAIALLVSVFCGILYTVLFVKIGKDDPVVVTPEYHTFAGVDSAQVGVIINERVNEENVVSLLLDWGRRGILTIQETAHDLVLTSVAALPDDAREYEKVLYSGLFQRLNQQVKVSSLSYCFYKTFEKVKRELENYYKNSLRELSTPLSKVTAIACLLSCWIPFGVTIALLHSAYYCDFIWLALLLVVVACLVGCGFAVRWFAMDYYVNNLSQNILAILLAIVCYITPFAYVVYLFIVTKSSILSLLAISLIQVIIIIEAAYMRKRTLYGNSMLSRVLGLREFIMNAQTQDLEELLEQNPYYFYDILPYAYSLGLNNKWNEHFKNLNVKPCEWFVPYSHHSSYNHYRMMHSLDSHMQTIKTNMTSFYSEGSHSSGSSSSGSGFSSSSGFGGSSGGSW